ncbi:hypothetical protein PQE68_gp158 [Bacillus phage vB_BanS_Sophrita]|uniref:Uncharacterized protein n=1 Tax=Bacillus phage vB_BanS_Sophrita TaxID=2894790 RepID=A0AAE8YXB2_9CAUD|nr:hypothetical protein PQE68_gp158 [Bacillus phage vB_BanS_Sophrita]UGO50749.1 hypothetical protein SOPHRITA_158 [Bacillus phage vB_BanS_Sophrita]
MNWLTKKVRDWLGITKLKSEYDLLYKTHKKLLEEYNTLNRKYSTIVANTESTISINKGLRERNEFILKNFKIAVDHYPRGNESWAVVCIEGKPEYVRLINLSRADVREIAYYLKQFDRDSRIVDSPVAFLKTDFFKL